MDAQPIWTDCDEARDYVVPNVLSPRDLHGVSRPDYRVPHTSDFSFFLFFFFFFNGIVKYLNNRYYLELTLSATRDPRV